MLCLNWFVNITASKNQQNVRAVSCTKMSCKCFLFVLIITQVKVAHPSKDQNASIDGCVSFNWTEDFFARHKQSEWNDTVNEIIEDCLSNYSKVNETTGCNGPIVNVTFPLFSCSSNATLLEREFSSVLVIKEESFTTGRQIVHAFAQIWELLVLCIIAAMLSGIVIWFLDHRANSGHFPDSFWRGVQDGLWWAVVTMTTVGYGDKAPKSSLARMYASLWMIIGMLLMSTITAQISSSITADGLRPLNDMFGSKVGIPLGSRKLFEKYNHGTNITEYPTERELLNGLMDGSVDKIWLFDCGTKEMKKQFSRLTIVDESIEYLSVRVGFAAKKGYEDIENCLQGRAEAWTYGKRATGQMDDYGYDYEDEDWQFSCFEKYSYGKYRYDMKQRSSKDGVEPFHYILLAFAGILVTFLRLGSLRNTCIKKRATPDDVDIEKGVFNPKLRASVTSAVHMKELSVPWSNYYLEMYASENITH